MIEPDEVGTFLLDYPGAWKNAALWRMVAEGANPDPQAIAMAYLNELARPTTPREVFRSLLDEGRFTAAQHLLDHPPFQDAMAGAIGDMRSLLERARSDAQMEVQVRWDDLERRASTCRDPLEEHGVETAAYLLARRDRLLAVEHLRPVELRIRNAEQSRVNTLRARLRDFDGHENAGTWREAVVRALDGTRIDQAEALLETGPDGTILTGPEADYPQPLPIGTLSSVELAELCEWSLTKQGGFARFYQVWDPLRDDDTAKPLIVAVHRLATSPAPSQAEAASFYQELQCLLHRKGDTPISVRTVSSGFSATIRGLDDMVSSAFRRDGVEFYVQRKGEHVEFPRAPANSAILFSLARSSGPSAGHAVVNPGDFFRCLSDVRHFCFHLLRHVSQQIPEDRIFPFAAPPTTWPSDDAQPMPFARLRALATRVFDLHGFDTADDAIDRLAFYAFGRPSLLYVLLRVLFARIDESGRGRAAKVTAAVVNGAQFDARYQQAAQAALLVSAEEDPVVHLVLAASLVTLHLMGRGVKLEQGIAEHDVEQWLLVESIDLSPAQRNEALARLEFDRLIVRDGAIFRPSVSGGGYMIPAVLNTEEYWNRAKTRYAARRA